MAESGVYRFGPFEFDPEIGELRRNGFRVPLEPQPTKALALLLERAGRTVTRDELRLHVWGPATFVDFDRGLAYCIAQARAALGDSADAARYIQTLPRRGFTFLAPVQRETAVHPAPAAGDTPDNPRPVNPMPGSAWSTRALALAVSILVVTAAALGITLWRDSSPTPSSQLKTRLAVAAFDNETGDASLEPVARGLSDAVVARLAQLRPESLGVIGNAAILQRSRTFRDVKGIGRELSASYVILGQLQLHGSQTRILVHLIRTDDETHLWADRFDREQPDWFALQSEIAEAAARAVEEKLLRPTSSPGSASPQAGF